MDALVRAYTGKYSYLRKEEWKKCAFHKERPVNVLDLAENVFLLLQVLRKFSFLCMRTCRKLRRSLAIELRFLSGSSDNLLDFLWQALKHFQDLETGSQWEINSSVHMLSICQLCIHIFVHNFAYSSTNWLIIIVAVSSLRMAECPMCSGSVVGQLI